MKVNDRSLADINRANRSKDDGGVKVPGVNTNRYPARSEGSYKGIPLYYSEMYEYFAPEAGFFNAGSKSDLTSRIDSLLAGTYQGHGGVTGSKLEALKKRRG
jgi:hypothetical protein